MSYFINNTYISGVSCSIIAYFIIQAITFIITKRRINKSPLTGHWHQKIIDPLGVIQKMDLVICTQKGSKVIASIKRLKPQNEVHKEWTFEGEFRKDLLFGIFWSKTENNYSNGTIQMLEQVQNDKILFEGFYTKTITQRIVTKRKLAIGKIIDNNKLIWEKIE